MTAPQLTGAGVLTAWQVAAGGRWEEAIRGMPGCMPSSKSALARLIATNCDVALELFFEAGGDHPAFLGVRFTDSQRRRVMVDRVLDRVVAASTTVERARAALREQLHQPTLFTAPPDTAEIGVVDAWQDVGSFILWRADDPIPTHETLTARLEARPALASHPSLPIACEFNCPLPQPHWLGVPVSRHRPPGFRVDPTLVRRTLTRYGSWGLSS